MKTSKFFKEKLEYLANLQESDYPFITMYLNINDQRFLEKNEQNRIFIKNAIVEEGARLWKEGNREKISSFERDQKRIKDYLENSMPTNTHGLAIFACDHLGVFEVVESIMPFDDYFQINSVPHLLQLAYQADEFENALIVMLDAKHSIIYELKTGGYLIKDKEILSDVHRFHKQGGWSQSKFQRGIEQEIDWHYRDTAQELTRIADEEAFENIILLGQDHEIKNFEKHLPKRIMSKVIKTARVNMKENLAHVFESILEDLKQKELKEEYTRIDQLVTRASSPDSCAIGLQETIGLAPQGRINVLAVLRNKEQHGYKCGDCLMIEKDQHLPGCPVCNGNLKDTDIIEEAVRYTLKNGGEIEIVKPETPAGELLERHEGIGAFLRY